MRCISPRVLSPGTRKEANQEPGYCRANPVRTRTKKLISSVACCTRKRSGMRVTKPVSTLRRAISLERQITKLCASMPPIYDHDHAEVKASNPAHGFAADIGGKRSIHVHLGGGEFLADAGMALTTGPRKIGAVNGGAGITRREDAVRAMATGAISNHLRSQL